MTRQTPQTSRFVSRFRAEEDGAVLVLWSVCVVLVLGFFGLIFDIGRLAATQSDLQSYADSVSLAAAAELDGRGDSITRAQQAAATLISDTQTFGAGDRQLDFASDVTLTFYKPGPDGRFSRSAALETTNPYNARFVQTQMRDRDVTPIIGAAFAALYGDTTPEGHVSARAVAGFSLEACNVAPIAACLPAVDFDASTAVGQSLELSASVNLSNLIPGQLAAVHTLTDQLDGLELCAGLNGGDLAACLVAARQPESACAGGGGLELSADLDATGLLESINTRFDIFEGVASGLLGDPDFSGGPNVLTGLTNELGLCLPLLDILPGLGGDDISLPADDCHDSGACGVQGGGDWSLGREAYIQAHYDGTDPFPEAQTRFEFYEAEIAASIAAEESDAGGLVGGIVGGVGGLLGGAFEPNLCAPQENKDTKRRLMVLAGIDCLSAEVDATVSAPPVQQFFEVFALGPAEGGKLKVEITACLGGDCGEGNLGTEVHDIVRLVE